MVNRTKPFSVVLLVMALTACGAENLAEQSAGSKTTHPADSNAVIAPAVTEQGESKLTLRQWAQEIYPTGQYNQEQESYTYGGNNIVFHDDGSATITAKQTSSTTWTSARISGPTLGTLTDSLPLYIEATIKTPAAAGTWPAFWLLGRGLWPMVGEIDIMEQINGNGNAYCSTHWGANPGNPSFDTSFVAAKIDLSQSHRYGAFLTDDGVQFYLDGKAAGNKVTFPPQANFSALALGMSPIINLAMGGQWPGKAPTNAGDQTLVIEQVITQKASPAN